MFETIEYCTRAVIRYLNGDMDLFKSYTRKAMKIYENEKDMVAVGEMIPIEIKRELYEMVS